LFIELTLTQQPSLLRDHPPHVHGLLRYTRFPWSNLNHVHDCYSVISKDTQPHNTQLRALLSLVVYNYPIYPVVKYRKCCLSQYSRPKAPRR